MDFGIRIIVWLVLVYLGYWALKRGFQWPTVKAWPWIWVLTALYTGIYFYWNLNRHASFNTFAIDMTVYMQALSSPRLFSNLLGKSLFADHFSPILFLWLPIGRLFSLPGFGFLIHALAMAFPAIPLYRISRRLGLAEWPALLMVFIYLNFYFTRQMALYDFRAESFMPGLLMLLIDFYLQGRDWRYWLTLALCLTIKEDVGFYLFFWALITLSLYPQRWLTHLITAGISLTASLVALILLLPANQGVYPYFSYWSGFGKGIFSILLGALSQPLATTAVFFKPTFWSLILPLAFLPAISWWGLAGLPTLWLQLASSHSLQAELKIYYVAPVLPFLFTALAAGWKKFETFIQTRRYAQLGQIALALFLLVFNLHWFPLQKVTAEHRALAQLLRHLPKRGIVLAQANVAPHIFRPTRVRVLGLQTPRRLPKVVVFHLRGNIWPATHERYMLWLNNFRLNSNYKIWKKEAGAIVFIKRKKQ